MRLLLVLVISIAVGVITIFGLICLIMRARVIEMHLRAALIKQMEATRQAERKSMSKSNAFAQASHDVRASLAGIIGLIDISYDEVSPGSELEKNLKQMEACAKDLLGFLNCILDTSKVEAGKMPLVEEEFDLAQLLEDVVDLYHPVAMRKGVDVVLDPNDGTVLKQSLVKGDRGKLKQILSNLLSNAVKFTDDGHISVRAWVQKPSLENMIFTSSGNSWWNRLMCFSSEKNDKDSGNEAMTEFRQNPHSAEFVFEVDDTGKGIPKEMRKSVFENYIQVKETAQGQEGTGLGLGIVQSLVRLMGGDIQIRDKDMGERGTCFRFNVFLAPCDAGATKLLEEDLEAGGYGAACHLGLTIRATSPGLSFRSSSTRQVRSPKPEGSPVVLLIQNEERRRTCQSYMEKLGIEVLVVSPWQDLPIILKKVQMKVVNDAYHSSSGKSEMSWRIERLSKSASCSKSCSRVRGVSLSSLDGADHILPVYRSPSHKDQVGFVLLIIDASAGPFQEIFMAVAEFRKLIPSTCCKVVWLDKPTMRSIDQRAINGNLDPDDIIMSKPFHGTRLLRVIRLLPEFGGSLQKRPSKQVKERPVQIAEATKPLAEETGSTSREKPLSGKRVLVVDDSQIMRKLALGNLSNLGATVQLSENGKEAVQLIREGIDEQRERGVLHIHCPYDYILMDCQMPAMDGYEATRKIRKEERRYGIHTPIIALTAHSSGAEVKKIFEAGMDFHVEKPANRVHLMKAISEIQSRGGGVQSSASNV
ncbi:histidine kinase CKI1-like [Syzygium oleosum]|uniref:histidine kinase CKI1-like n=1 Tax=Syzygium oleosum TaxID=219896 RepID=UPI0011D21FCE|nr:histidine kinase CKI1-like [Syzygium oleosum]